MFPIWRYLVYVNHKPVVSNNEEQEIEEALTRISQLSRNLEDADNETSQLEVVKKFLAENGTIFLLLLL